MIFRLSTLSLVFILIFNACRKGDLMENFPPDTQISLEAINLSGDDRLNSQLTLNWFGTDRDGFIEGFEISLDNQNWFYTTLQDSTFQFDLPAGSDTVDIDFYVRAVDDDGAVDPSPAYLKVPLKNSPPQVKLDNGRGPGDTAFIVSTFYWNASDPDGNQSINQVLVKFNQGEWTEISTGQNLISFVVDTAVSNGAASASIYYGKNSQAESFSIDGLNVGGMNELYIKAIDIAGTESVVDTADAFYLRNKSAGVNTLWVNAHALSIAQMYRSYLNNAGVTYDFLDYGRNQGGDQPVYWDPTFRLILDQYDKLFINSPSSRFSNAQTGQNAILLEYLAPIIQAYQDNGGKSFVTTLLDKSLTEQELGNIAGSFPLQTIVRSNGFVRIYPDSTIYNVSNVNTPDLRPVNIQTGIVPIVKTSDSENFYRAEITPLQGWSGDNLVATIRRNVQGQTQQVFFAVELHNYNRIPGTVEQLIGEILKNEF